MGFWGSLVVVRRSGLAGLAALGDHADDVDGEWRGGDWTVGQFGDADVDLSAVAALTEQTGGPVLVAQVSDSDNAVIRGAILGDAGWETTLRPASMRRTIESLGHDYDSLFPMTPDEATTRAVLWARAAGLDPDVHNVERSLRTDDCAFVEDRFFDLLQHLGPPDLIAPESGDA